MGYELPFRPVTPPRSRRKPSQGSPRTSEPDEIYEDEKISKYREQTEKFRDKLSGKGFPHTLFNRPPKPKKPEYSENPDEQKRGNRKRGEQKRGDQKSGKKPVKDELSVPDEGPLSAVPWFSSKQDPCRDALRNYKSETGFKSPLNSDFSMQTELYHRSENRAKRETNKWNNAKSQKHPRGQHLASLARIAQEAWFIAFTERARMCKDFVGYDEHEDFGGHANAARFCEQMEGVMKTHADHPDGVSNSVTDYLI